MLIGETYPMYVKHGVSLKPHFLRNKKLKKGFEKLGRNLITYDVDTGEVLEGRFITPEEEIRRKKYFEDRKVNEAYLQYCRADDSFVWAVYTLLQKFDLKISPANLTRMIFLSTYVNYEGILTSDGKTLLTKPKIQKLMGISDGTFKYFWREVTKNNLIVVDGEKNLVNRELFSKGKLKNDYLGELFQKNKCVMRFYVNGIRALYNNVDINCHKALSYIFAIIPFVNRSQNILCYNPLEEKIENIIPMNLKEFCAIIGYDNSHAARIKKELGSCYFIDKDGKKRSVIYFAVSGNQTIERYLILISPYIYYGGKNKNNVSAIFNFKTGEFD